VYGILHSPVLGYVKKSAQLRCTLLLYNDFVLQIHGFKFSYLENVLNEGIIIVEYIFPYAICSLYASYMVN
jgi:hypothetical protein